MWMTLLGALFIYILASGGSFLKETVECSGESEEQRRREWESRVE